MAILPSNNISARLFLYAAKNPIIIAKGALGTNVQTLQGILYEKSNVDGSFSIPINANNPLIAERETIQFHFNVSPILATAFPEPILLPNNVKYRKREKAVKEFCLKTRDYNAQSEIAIEEQFFAINSFLGIMQPNDFFSLPQFNGILSQSPLRKKTSLNSQEYLSLLINLSPAPTKIKLILSYKTSIQNTITVLEFSEGITEYDVYDFDVSPKNLPIQDIELDYYELQFVNQNNKPLSAKFMYIIRQQIEQNYSSIVFLNTLGSFETFNFHGYTEQNRENASEIFTDNNYVRRKYYNEITQKIKLRTDPLMRYWKNYLVRELDSSQSIFWKIGEKLYPIINISNSLKNEDELETEETLEIEFEIAQKEIIQ